MYWTVFPLLDQIAKPSNVLLMAMALAMLLALFVRGRWAIWLAALGMAAYMGASVVPIGEWLLIPLEDRFPAADPPPGEVAGILVVSQRIAGEIAQARGRLQGPGAELAALIELGRRYPEARIVLTGIGESTSAATMRQTEWVRAFLGGQGFDASRVTFADEARSNHHDMFVHAHALAKPTAGETWLLVQKAAEMPRGMGVARQLGWRPLPWPVNYMTTGERKPLAPHLRPTYYLYLIDVAVREFAMLNVYFARGWTSERFPAP